MNNSLIRHLDDEERVDIKPILRKRETEILDIIEALGQIIVMPAWETLKKRIFTGLTESLERQLMVESTQKELDLPEIYRLNGQLMWAKKYSDLEKLVENYTLELVNVRKKLNAENN